MRSNNLFFLSATALPFCSITVGGVSLALALMLVILVFLLWTQPRIAVWIIGILLALMLKYLNDEPNDFIEWIKSAILFSVNFSTFIGVGLIAKSSYNNHVSQKNILWLYNFLITFFALHGLFLVIQYFSMNYLNSLLLLNPFGAFSPPGPNPDTGQLSAYNPIFQQLKRPNGLAWEPSVAALWQILGLILIFRNIKTIQNRNLKTMLMIAGLVSTLSMIGYLVFGIMIATHLYFRYINLIVAKVFVVPLFTVITLAVHSFLDVLITTTRFSEFAQVGASGYIRFTAPLELIYQRGLTMLGTEELGSRSYRDMLIFQSNDSSLAGIANMYFELFIYFGVCGIALFLFVVAMLIYKSQANPMLIVFLILFPLFGGYAFNVLALYPIFVVLMTHFLLRSEMGRSKKTSNFSYKKM